MTIDRNIEKNLIGTEDLLLGSGSSNQTRASGVVSITKVEGGTIPWTTLLAWNIRAYVMKNSFTTNLNDISNAINTTNKEMGKRVYNFTTNKAVWAVGPDPGDIWVDSVGATAHTPV